MVTTSPRFGLSYKILRYLAFHSYTYKMEIAIPPVTSWVIVRIEADLVCKVPSTGFGTLNKVLTFFFSKMCRLWAFE